MFLLYIGGYTLTLALVWGLFFVLKIHAYKFKNFSDNIEKMTTLLLIFLAILSIMGYIFIIFGYDSEMSFEIDTDSGSSSYSEIDY